jgi:hypothetical protein
MEMTIMSGDRSVKIRCIAIIRDAPKTELTVVLRDNSWIVLKENHSFRASDLGILIYISEKDFDEILLDLNGIAKEIWE